MSKANTIRKKALEYARRQDWEAAIREYRRLADIDQSNPNLYNELGDIYLKTGNKSEAYDSFVSAIDAYTRVSLFNNAVAVCKKVTRLIPARYEVLAKLGCIRKRQGLAKEAETYCLQYLEQLGQDSNVVSEGLVKVVEEISETMSDCAVVLDRLAERLFNNGLDTEASHVLAILFRLYDAEGIVDARDEVCGRLKSMGMDHLVVDETSPEPEPAKEGPLMTEDNLWTDSLSEGERITVEGGPPAEMAPAAPAAPVAGPQTASADDTDYRTVALPDIDDADSADAPAAGAASGPPVTLVTPPPADSAPLDLPTEQAETTPADGFANHDSDIVHVSAIIGDEGESADGDPGDDNRSHYDLGMAYLEMNLYSEAVREYQLAARSSEYLVKSLEMIGLCFLEQNQARLAIKQLTKGLSQIDESNDDALGIKYNLGLAYEMLGDTDKALTMYEDVYVVDVSFRDVAEKIQKFSG